MGDDLDRLAAARRLASLAGRDALAAIVADLDAGAEPLAVVSRLRAQGNPVAWTSLLMEAADARRRARSRWTNADEMLFTRSGWEQASDPQVAKWRATRFGRNVSASSTSILWDLCAGVGADSLALGAYGPVHCVEADSVHATLLAANAQTAGVDAQVLCRDARTVTLTRESLVHADPARRDAAGRRLRSLSQTQPSVQELVVAARQADGLCLTVSPGLDWQDPVLINLIDKGCQIEFIQRGRQLVEANVWLGALAADPGAAATIVTRGAHHHRVRDQASQPDLRDDWGDLLLVAAPAAIRARIHDEVFAEIGAWRPLVERAVGTCNGQPSSSVWYDAEPIEWRSGGDLRQLRRWLRAHDEAPVELVLHGAQVDEQQFWHALKGVARGPNGRRVHLLRHRRGLTTIVTSGRLSSEGSMTRMTEDDT